MINHPVPDEPFQLDVLRALYDYLARVGSDPAGANQIVRKALGAPHGESGDQLLMAFQLVTLQRLDEAAALLLQLGLKDPALIPPVYQVLAMVFKYLTTGQPLPTLAMYGMNPVVAFYRQYPGHPAAQRALVDLLLYFGRVDSLTNVLANVDPRAFSAEIGDYQQCRHRLASYQDRCQLSIVLITWQRPEHLRHTLQQLRESLWSTDVEIVIGVNDDWEATREVIREAGISKAVFNTSNTGINFYRDVFPLAEGRFLIEIDDDIAAFPPHFDKAVIEALESDPELGLVGHWPERYHLLATGEQQAGLAPMHQMQERFGMPFGIGPVSGACAGMRRQDFLQINGFSRATLSAMSGEEMQLIRKLSVHGKVSGVFFNQGLEVKVL